MSTVQRLVDMGLLLSRPDDVDRVINLVADGDLATGADEMAALNTAESNVHTQLLEAVARVSLGQRDEAAAILSEVEEVLPADPEVAGWKNVTEQPVPAPAAAVDLDLTAEAVIADLFSTNRMGFEVEEQFVTTYSGQTIFGRQL